MSTNSRLGVIALFVVFIAGSILTTAASNGVVQGHGNILNMVLLGEVEGKSYYTEDGQRNWYEAYLLCDSSDMRLATITSTAQVAFLQNAYNNVTFHYDHWIGAQDASDSSRYSWVHNKEKMDDTLLFFTGIPGPTSCMAIDSNPNQGSHFHAHTCYSSLKTLCEKIPA